MVKWARGFVPPGPMYRIQHPVAVSVALNVCGAKRGKVDADFRTTDNPWTPSGRLPKSTATL